MMLEFSEFGYEVDQLECDECGRVGQWCLEDDGWLMCKCGAIKEDLDQDEFNQITLSKVDKSFKSCEICDKPCDVGDSVCLRCEKLIFDAMNE